jgi:iron complex transport system substrate-binding protein
VIPAALAIAAALVASPGATSGPATQPGAEHRIRRIVSLAPNLTEILFALDLGDRVVGVTDYCDYPPAAAKKPRVGGYVNPNLEAIVALDPDLALATPNIGNREGVLKLQSLGVELLVVETPTLASLSEAIRLIAARAGEPERGVELAAHLSAEIEALRTRSAALPAVRSLLVFSHEPLIAAGPGTLFDEMLRAAGGTNLAAGMGPYPHLSLEQVVMLAPEAIIDTAMTATGENDARFWDRLSTVPAVRDRRICSPAADPILRPGPRVVQGIRLLADCLHPEARRPEKGADARPPGAGR